jgi:hypothetical protein
MRFFYAMNTAIPPFFRRALTIHEDRWSEHGLGHLRNPLNPDSEDRGWIPQAWINIHS